MLTEEFVNGVIDDLLAYFGEPREWDDVRSRDIYLKSLTESFPSEQILYSAVHRSIVDLKFFPKIVEIVDRMPNNPVKPPQELPRLTNQAKAIPGPTGDKKQRTPAEIKAVEYDNYPEDIGKAIEAALEKYPNIQKPGSLNARKELSVWVGNQFGYSNFEDLAEAVKKIGRWFGVGNKLAEKWVYLDFNGNFDHLKR